MRWRRALSPSPILLVGAPDKAIEGFLKSAGLTSVDECEIRDVKGKQFYFSISEKKGGTAESKLLDVLRPVFWSFPWPKSMRWADSRASWVRPIHGILLLFNGNGVQGRISFE